MKKAPFLPSPPFPRLLAIATLCSISIAHSQTILFSDNFDGSPYTDDVNLVAGPGQIEHGIWGRNNTGGGKTITSTAASLSAPRALALQVGTESGKAGIVGNFSENGGDNQTVTNGFTLRFSFMMKDTVFGNSQFYIYGDGERAAQVNIGDEVKAFHHGKSSVVSSGLLADTWYTVEINMPTISSSSDTYTVSLYDNDGTLMGTSTGTFYSTTGIAGYQYFAIHNTTEDTTLFIDNVSAVVSEPKTSMRPPRLPPRI